jgi:hypothetical protein
VHTPKYIQKVLESVTMDSNDLKDIIISDEEERENQIHELIGQKTTIS